MNSPVSSIAKRKIGCCPHGLPAGACPICSSMGGGGGSSKKAERPAGEMTWDECVAMGQILKAQRLAQQQRQLAALQHVQIQPNPTLADRMGNLAQKISTISEKLATFIDKAKQTPTIIAKTLAIAAKIAIPILNIIQSVPVAAQKILNSIGQKFVDISDKLTAVFGEIKNSIEKKISDAFKNSKKKLKSLFGIFEPIETDEEEQKIQEDKRIFDLKSTFEKIKEKIYSNHEKDIENGYKSA